MVALDPAAARDRKLVIWMVVVFLLLLVVLARRKGRSVVEEGIGSFILIVLIGLLVG